MCTQVEIISDPNYTSSLKVIFKAPNLVYTSNISGNLEEGKVLEFGKNLFFLVHKNL